MAIPAGDGIMFALRSPAVSFATYHIPSVGKSYELVCTATSATIRIGSGTYNVLSIDYTDSYFWVVDANLGMQSSCPLPRWDHGDAAYYAPTAQGKPVSIEFATPSNGTMDSFIYVSTKSWYSVEAYEFVPSCGYLAATPLGGPGTTIHHVNVVRLVGFCSEETTRALIYEFMPRGSLDKYIFSLEKSFSWDKLNEIALDGRRAQEC
nr:unnamed protein product [Digitaria exilis]